MPRRKWIILICVLIAAGMILSACGGSQSAPDKDPAAEKPAQQQSNQVSGPPKPSHGVEGDFTDCLSCHDKDSPVNRPSPHPERGNCAACHKP